MTDRLAWPAVKLPKYQTFLEPIQFIYRKV